MLLFGFSCTMGIKCYPYTGHSMVFLANPYRVCYFSTFCFSLPRRPNYRQRCDLERLAGPVLNPCSLQAHRRYRGREARNGKKRKPSGKLQAEILKWKRVQKLLLRITGNMEISQRSRVPGQRRSLMFVECFHLEVLSSENEYKK